METITTTTVKKTGGKAKKITIDLRLCKGCAICVDLCPTATLEMKDGKSAVKDLSLCIKCDLCELRCPDFAIQVFPLDE